MPRGRASSTAKFGFETVKVEDGIAGETLPLHIWPKEDTSIDFLQGWIAAHKEWLTDQLHEFGAVKFTGFDLRTPTDMENVVLKFDKLSNEYRGTSPRNLQPGSNYVFSASELPGYFPIPQHLEMSFLPHPPSRLYFFCQTECKSFGGETTLADNRKVYGQMDLKLVDKFERKGVTCIRNYDSEKVWYKFDPWKLKGWRNVFETDSKAEVTQECERTGLTAEWGPNDSLRIVNTQGAARTHPVTGDRVWSNHTLTFHTCMAPQEFYRTARRAQSVYYLIMSLLMYLYVLLKRLTSRSIDLGMHMTFGDGTEITDTEMAHVRDVTWKNLKFPRWHTGDLLMIDNCAVSHGRQPYSGPRKVLVAWSDETQGAAEMD